MFEVSKKMSYEEIYKEIAEDLRSEYRFTFTPDDKGARYGYHQIELTFTKPEGKKWELLVREGYWVGN
jgi:hypothetical protein